MAANIGSCKPHAKLGFVQVGTDYCISRRDGSTSHQYNFLMVNPTYPPMINPAASSEP